MWHIDVLTTALDLMLDYCLLTNPLRLWAFLTKLDRHFESVDESIKEIKELISIFEAL
ncbi:hypothetical protein [Leptolyngbya sp. FACHB-16]|uniref:hypothetical protein n=1 Tax=unclassified Leptolyngbya TaxID=2650499 RepID=UPI00168620AF|nr:hypothetical protein [Leptolyngbya sp. FACHB-16]MBD2156261.1 hypothetical protein [Leptolyngbya sp. FACHB-16]